MSKRARSPSPASPPIFTSSPILERSSKFIAFFSPTLSVRQLREQPEISDATHRIAAWRKPSNQSSLSSSQRLFDTGHDDDGEKYGGKPLALVLASSQVEGSVVVARWYGGVMLGPVRFEHIRNCASEAIEKWRSENDKASKKLKSKQDEKKRAQLVQILAERDQSITILRDLLAAKKQDSPNASQKKGSPANPPDYSKVSLATLEKLDHAKDATLSWILKEIEKAEASDALGKASAGEKGADKSPVTSIADQ